MTSEHKPADSSSFGFSGKDISGFIEYNTDNGPVRIEFSSAKIHIQPKECDVSDQRDETKDPGLIQEYLSAKKGLDEYIQSLPDSDPNKHCEQRELWMDRWDSEMQEFNGDALIGLFPRKLEKQTTVVVRLLNGLLRQRFHGYQIATKADLLNIPDHKIKQMQGIGEKNIKLVKMMKNVINSENKLKEINLTPDGEK